MRYVICNYFNGDSRNAAQGVDSSLFGAERRETALTFKKSGPFSLAERTYGGHPV